MEQLRLFLRQVAGYLILSALIENLAAKKEYGPYIRLFLNLLLVFMFVSPILSISADRLGETWLEVSAVWPSQTSLEEDLRKLNDSQTTMELAAQKRILESELKGLLAGKGYGLDSLFVRENEEGDITDITVTVIQQADYEYRGVSYGEETDPQRMLETYLKEELSALCGIHVRLKGSEGEDGDEVGMAF